jgi:TRAP-type mannitol/chloroaromatic compound transport system substrate-binding protein
MRLPDPVLADLKSHAKDAVSDIAAGDPMAQKVNESFERFKKIIGPWGEVSERPYYNAIADRYPLTGS